MFNYFQKINNIKKTNISIEEKNIPINKVPNKNFKNKRNNNNDDNSNNKANSEENDELSDDFIESENKLLIKKTKKTKNNSLEILDLTDEEKKEIFINNKYVPLIKYITKTKTKTKYIFKSKSKNYIFYKCKLNKNCEGRGKIDIKNKTFIVTKYCNNKSEHEIISYIDFVDLVQKKEYNKIDFSNKKIQKYYAFYFIKNNNDLDNPTIIKNFNTLTNIKLNLSKPELSQIRGKAFDEYENLDLVQFIE